MSHVTTSQCTCFQGLASFWELLFCWPFSADVLVIFGFIQMALISPTDEQFDILLHKLKERLDEGHGETIYEVGVGGERNKKDEEIIVSLLLVQ